MRQFLTEQLHQLWDQFHLASDDSTVPTLRAVAAGQAHALHSLAHASSSDNDIKWILGALCDAEIFAGRLARDQLNYEAAIRHQKQALALALDANHPVAVAASSMRLGETLIEAGLVLEALGYCNAGIQHGTHANSGSLLNRALSKPLTFDRHIELHLGTPHAYAVPMLLLDRQP